MSNCYKQEPENPLAQIKNLDKLYFPRGKFLQYGAQKTQKNQIWDTNREIKGLQKLKNKNYESLQFQIKFKTDTQEKLYQNLNYANTNIQFKKQELRQSWDTKLIQKRNFETEVGRSLYVESLNYPKQSNKNTIINSDRKQEYFENKSTAVLDSQMRPSAAISPIVIHPESIEDSLVMQTSYDETLEGQKGQICNLCNQEKVQQGKSKTPNNFYRKNQQKTGFKNFDDPMNRDLPIENFLSENDAVIQEFEHTNTQKTRNPNDQFVRESFESQKRLDDGQVISLYSGAGQAIQNYQRYLLQKDKSYELYKKQYKPSEN